MIDTAITESDLRAEYRRARPDGAGFEAALANPAQRLALENGIKARRRQAARLSLANPANYHVEKEEAA